MGPVVSQVVDDHVYTLDAWPLGVAAGGIAACTLALALLLVAGRKRDRRDDLAALVAFLGLAVMLGGLGWSAVPWVGVLLHHAISSPARSCWRLFPSTMIAGSALGAASSLLGGALLIAWLRRRTGWALGVPIGLLCALGVTAALAGPWLTWRLEQARNLPRIEASGPAWVHAGERAVLRPRLVHGATSGWSHPAPIRLAPRREGRARLAASATHDLLRVERVWRLRVRRALADPSLPLQVGNRWRYRWTRSTGGALLWGMVRTGGPSSAGRLELAVTETRVSQGVRQFRLSRFDERRGAQHWWLYPLDGRTYVLGGERPAAGDVALDLPPPGSDASFSIPMLPGACHGIARGEAPGPCSCEARGGADVPSVVATVLTLGLVIPRDRDDTVLMLEASELGHGPAVPSATVPASVPAPTAPPTCDVGTSRRSWFCVVASPADRARAPELARRLTRAGLRAVALADGRVATKARRDQALRLLGARIRGRARETGPCPGWRCEPHLEHDALPPLLSGVSSLDLELEACDAVP